MGGRARGGLSAIGGGQRLQPGSRLSRAFSAPPNRHNHFSGRNTLRVDLHLGTLMPLRKQETFGQGRTPLRGLQGVGYRAAGRSVLVEELRHNIDYNPQHATHPLAVNSQPVAVLLPAT